MMGSDDDERRVMGVLCSNGRRGDWWDWWD